MSATKVIIDTDPGTDDTLALLLALASNAKDIEVLLISVTYGNVEVQNCLRNVVSMFNVIEKEMAWRRGKGQSEGFEAMRRCKPVVAVGAKEPLGGQNMMADYFHGIDGLGNVHTTHPHHTSNPNLWSHLFDAPPKDTLLSSTATENAHIPRATHTDLFTPSSASSHLEILSILDANPPDTITLVGIGPLTNFALAAAESPITFLKAKEVIVMSGAISVPGNITPVAEFNCIADPIAAARVYALTSPDPASTMPPDSISNRAELLPKYPPKEQLGESRLNVTLFPLDITTPHTLSSEAVAARTRPLVAQGSPLAEWVAAFLDATFKKEMSLYRDSEGVEVPFHDPICIWYALSASFWSTEGPRLWNVRQREDIRVETMGQWTRGMYVIDRRGRAELDDEAANGNSDNGGWLSRKKGNRLGRCVNTPGEKELEKVILNTLFGSN